MLTQQAYYDIKHLIAPGDIIAFGGTSLFSRWTKLTTRSVVTHTALVIDSPDDNRSTSAAQDLTMIEATSIKGKKGVMHNYVEERIKHYKGDVWWLPLHDEAKQQLQNNWHGFHDFLAGELGKDYDIWQLFGAAIDVFETEPPGEHPLLANPRVLATPHLGASTEEAQEKTETSEEQTQEAKPTRGRENKTQRSRRAK